MNNVSWCMKKKFDSLNNILSLAFISLTTKKKQKRESMKWLTCMLTHLLNLIFYLLVWNRVRFQSRVQWHMSGVWSPKFDYHQHHNHALFAYLHVNTCVITFFVWRRKERELYVRRKLDSRSVFIHFFFFTFSLYTQIRIEWMSKSVQSNDTVLYISNVRVCIRFKYRVKKKKRRRERERREKESPIAITRLIAMRKREEQ
jgi:cytochrome bd-type quinol oxidase subunit 2